MKQYFSFQLHITDECDQRCKHCYIFSENNCKKLDSISWIRSITALISVIYMIEFLTFILPAEILFFILIFGNCCLL